AQPERATRLVAIWPLSHEASVAEYAELAHAAVDELIAAGRTPLVAGGTGLYLRAALADLNVPPAPPPGARERWERRYDAEGATAVHAVLEERDPAAAAAIHPNDRRRVVRALELTDVGASLRPPDSRLWGEETRRPTAVFGLDLPSDELERRIERRAHAMIEAGAIGEARRALAGPLSSTAQHVLGLRGLAELPEAEALEQLIARTRRYAAYQRKWMRRIAGLTLLDATRPPDQVADELLAAVRRA
ncbi:MAG: tRNA (adenosine(37)-N6)-dimethylallyltransferase, partial [Gaiellaceae bacterium]